MPITSVETQLLDYFSWKDQNQGQVTKEKVIQCVVTDELLRQGKERGPEAAKAMMGLMAMELYAHGLKPLEAHVDLNRDSACWQSELLVTVASSFEGTEAQYCVMAYWACRDEQERRKALECLSLWGHIKYWWRRRCQSGGMSFRRGGCQGNGG